MMKEYIQIETHIYIYIQEKKRRTKKKKILTLSIRHKRSVYTLGYETAKEK